MMQKMPSFIKWIYVAAFLAAILSPEMANGTSPTRTSADRDFLNYGGAARFQNYALFPYHPYPLFGREVALYDRLGQYLLQGRVSISVDERRPGLSEVQGIPFAAYYETEAPLKYSVIRDSYKGFSHALAILFANPDINQGMLAEGLQTRFSPLTLNIARYAGVRFDGNGAKNKVSLIYTRGCGDRRKFSYLTMGRHEKSPVILWGGHWESTIGGALRIGTSFVNQHLSDATSQRGSILHGDLSYEMSPPRVITVRIVDDSPEDRSSPAAAYKVSIILRGVDENGVSHSVTNDPALVKDGVELERQLALGATGRWVGDHFEAVGIRERIEYRFMMALVGFQPRRAEFVAVLGGDYRVQVRQIHEHHYMDWKGNPQVMDHEWPSKPKYIRYEFAFLSGSHSLRYPMDFKFPELDPAYASVRSDEELALLESEKPRQWDPAYTVVRADGHPRDVTPKVVRFNYGMPTAQTIVSVDVDFDFAGVQIVGELALNTQDFKFPVKKGQRTSKFVSAFFLTGSYELPGLPPRFRPVVGGELFDIPPDYSGNYDSKRGGAVFFTGVPVSPPNEAITQEFNLFDDNDDGDQWPDDHPSDTPLCEINDAGVFPGLDENHDNVVDTDQNGNSVPDWEEPFLFYRSDPPEFIYDVDFNNNDLPDLTENDDEPDYPYRRDQKGYHWFVDFPHLIPLVDKLSFGYYNTKQTADGGKNRAFYGRFRIRYARPGLGRLALLGDVKRVEDSIPDPGYLFKTVEDFWANQSVLQRWWKPYKDYRIEGILPPDPDPMLMRNSTVSTLYFEARWTPLKDLEFQIRDQVRVNKQRAMDLPDGGRQEKCTVDRLTLSNKVGYTYPLTGNLTLSARAKHLYYRKRGYANSPYWSTFGTTFEAVLKLTEKTRLHTGQEGIPFLPVRHRARGSYGGDFDRWTTVMFLRTDGDYWGWKLTSELGVQFQTFDREGDKSKERAFFVEMYFGY
jgi:hypothetical protein